MLVNSTLKYNLKYSLFHSCLKLFYCGTLEMVTLCDLCTGGPVLVICVEGLGREGVQNVRVRLQEAWICVVPCCDSGGH